MRTGSYAYHVARRDVLAFGGELDVSHWDRFSAESEDACALYDALQSYDEHAAREYARVLTRQRIKGKRRVVRHMKPLNAAQLRHQYELETSPRYAWYREFRAAALFAGLVVGVIAMGWLFMHIADVLAR